MTRREQEDKGPGEGKERSTWANKGDFFMTAISSAIGLGNIWRFPYKCYSNGGGAFLFAFIVTIILVGCPLVFLDLALGQLGRCGPLEIWRICPAFEGVGWAILGLDLVANFYYILLVAMGLLYMFYSFQSKLPWASCGNEWNTEACRDIEWILAQKDCLAQNGSWSNSTCSLATNINQTTFNTSLGLDRDWVKPISPSEEFFHHEVLDLSPGISHVGHVQLPLLGCLFLAWFLVFIGLSFGLRSWGKISYVTTILPYIILTAILVQTLAEEGATDGIIFFFKPQWSKLATATTWADAIVQAFYSLNCGGGCLITIGSFNKPKNNCFLDGIIIILCDFFTSILCGLVVFAILGHLAHSLHLQVSEVVGQGAGLAFVAYPEMLARLPMAPVWSSLFMFMVFNLGLGTSMPITANVQTILVEKFPAFFNRCGKRRLFLLVGLIVVWASVGVTLTTQAGMYILQMLDSTAPYVLVITGLCKVLAIGWVYGINKIVGHLGRMVNSCIITLWTITCKFTAPACILVVLIFNFINYQKLSYGSYQFPIWADIFCWTITLILIATIPVTTFYNLLKMDRKIPLQKRMQLLVKPTGQWDEENVDMVSEAEVMKPLKI